MRYIFFSLRNFEIDAGENVRIYGLLNSFALAGNEVVFISNAKRYEMFSHSIKHVFIGYEFRKKRVFQGLLALLQYRFAYYRFNKLFRKIKAALLTVEIRNEPIIFFDYLDNSIGYVLKRKGIIAKYVNDIHGIATIEFLNHIKNSKSIKRKLVNKLKYYLAYKLDKKVFRFADYLIYGSENMKMYYEKLYNLKSKKYFIIPYLLDENVINRKIDIELKNRLEYEFKITPESFVVLFVGSYKPLAGIDDLIKAFELLHAEYKDCKLLLIGNGPYKNDCVKLANKLKSKTNINFVEHIPYSQLVTYQSLANVIVCPDKNNLFSHYVIHVKYFDALVSGKIVIIGAFDSVLEINKNNFLSLTFEPSDVNDLYRKLKLCKEKFGELTEIYQTSSDYVAKHFTYGPYLKKNRYMAGVYEGDEMIIK